jgi:hypothetical protein
MGGPWGGFPWAGGVRWFAMVRDGSGQLPMGYIYLDDMGMMNRRAQRLYHGYYDLPWPSCDANPTLELDIPTAVLVVIDVAAALVLRCPSVVVGIASGI